MHAQDNECHTVIPAIYGSVSLLLAFVLCPLLCSLLDKAEQSWVGNEAERCTGENTEMAFVCEWDYIASYWQSVTRLCFVTNSLYKLMVIAVFSTFQRFSLCAIASALLNVKWMLLGLLIVMVAILAYHDRGDHYILRMFLSFLFSHHTFPVIGQPIYRSFSIRRGLVLYRTFAVLISLEVPPKTNQSEKP